MIEISALNDTPVMQGQLPDGATAYIDADWIAPAGVTTAALVLSRNGDVFWASDPAHRVRSNGAADEVVERVLLQIVEQAVAAVADIPCELVGVQGRGLLAAWIRDRLGMGDRARPNASARRPRAVIDLTGNAASVVSATQAVEDLGIVVLAGLTSSVASIDLYSDVHARCLRVIGVSASLCEVFSRDGSDIKSPVPRVRDIEMRVYCGRPFPSDALLYRLSD